MDNTQLEKQIKLLKEKFRKEEDETEILENLEDEYHIDLTEFYGSPERVDELYKKLKGMK